MDMSTSYNTFSDEVSSIKLKMTKPDDSSKYIEFDFSNCYLSSQDKSVANFRVGTQKISYDVRDFLVLCKDI